MTMRFFQSVTSLEGLKKQFRKLALELHPDKGGNEKDFINMKDEYDQLVKEMSSGSAAKEFENFNSEAFKSIIEKLINYDIELEIIGTWIWVSGNTFEAKTTLKELNFKWASKKKAWYFHEGDYKKKGKKNYSLEEIRTMHEWQKIKTNRKAALGL